MQKKSIILLVVLLPFFLFGCAATPDMIAKDAILDSQTYDPPKVQLSEFTAAKLKPMEMIDAISSDPGSLEIAKTLEMQFKTLVDPLITQWPTSGTEERILTIQPKLVEMRLVSGATRFFAGFAAGQSWMSMELVLLDSKTGNVIANPKITKKTLASGGSGATDSNLSEYIANIAHQYLVVNSNPQ